ncbi:MAG: RluA family pseudouridine synthase [Epsilonproteobacteria bacterium]|nr:RluA family pseudouridine synthase [Campylobacterota bacterium]
MPFIKKKFFIEKKIKSFLFLIREFNLSQGEAQRFIDKGRLLIDETPMRDKSKTIQGEVELILFEPKSLGVTPIFWNRDFVIFDKPSGVLVHPKDLNTPYSMLDEIRYSGGGRANPVHRIDKETSGLLLASRDRESERYLKNLFQTKQIEKSYLAWVNGRVEREFTIEEPIAVRRDYTSSKHKVEISKYGKFAKTIFRPKFYNESLDSSLIECFPITGRTHQIRVHLYHIGYPIIGDPIYGVSNSIAQRYLDDELSQYERVEATGAKRLMLHANSLQFKYKNIYKIYSKMEFKCEI